MRLGGTLLVVFVLGLILASGLLPLPFGNTFSEKPKVARIGQTPCPLPGVKPYKPANIKIEVFNGTARNGLAGKVAADLKQRGFGVIGTGNSPDGEYDGVARVVTGTEGVTAAYMVRAHIPETKIELDGTVGSNLKLFIGNRYDGMAEKAGADRELKKKALTPIPGCLPVGDASVENRQ